MCVENADLQNTRVHSARLPPKDTPMLFKFHATHLARGQSPMPKMLLLKLQPNMGGKIWTQMDRIRYTLSVRIWAIKRS